MANLVSLAIFNFPNMTTLLRSLLCCIFLAYATAYAQHPPNIPTASQVEVYKTVDEVELQAWIFNPPKHKAGNKRPAIIFFFGGGWRAGSPTQFTKHCEYLASRGMVAITVDYRVASRHGVKANSCVADAKSTIRWMRKNARRLGIDPNRIVASGGSAGGHLAAATATLPGHDDPTDRRRISAQPNTLALFNPALVLDDIPGTFEIPTERKQSLRNRMGADLASMSPYHHIHSEMGPSIIFHGKADKTVAYQTVELFEEAMREKGNECDLVGYEGKPHGFFNYMRDGNQAFQATLERLDQFLVEIGYLQERVIARTYKQVDTVALGMDIHYPPYVREGEKLPVMVFFFGGGWNGGTIEQFRPHAEYFSDRGMIVGLADYRVKSRQGTTPFDAVRDAKSAVRYLREHADELGIDPNKIIAAGGSAGGHLAAAAGNVSGLEETGEDLSISSKPNALVLFNPVYDNGPGQYGYDRIGERYPEISPKHNIQTGAPPTIVFFGTKDKLISVETAQNYEEAMNAVGSRCETFFYEGQPHGFFNFRSPKYYRATVYEADRFLTSLGYLEGTPSISPQIKVLVWDERQPKQKSVYPNFLGNQIAEHLRKNEALEVKSVCIDDPDQGLSDADLDDIEVIVWWGHRRHTEISMAKSRRLVERVKAGELQIIFLHSAHWANPFVAAMNEITRQRTEDEYAEMGDRVEIEYAYIPDSLRFRVPKHDELVTPLTMEQRFPDGRIQVIVDMPSCVFPFYEPHGKPSTIFNLNPEHPITKGIPAKFILPSTEMYGGPFHVPEPDELLFEERWESGKWFESGAVWNLDKGKIFYFRPGHETYKVYVEEMPLKIIENAVLWMRGYQ